MRTSAKSKSGGVYICGWSSASKEAQAMWEKLQTEHVDALDTLESVSSKLTLMSGNLQEFYTASLEIRDHDPHAIIRHLIRKRLHSITSKPQQEVEEEEIDEEEFGGEDWETEHWPTEDYCHYTGNDDELPF